MTDKVGDGKAVVDWTDEAQAIAALGPSLEGLRPAFGEEQHPAPKVEVEEAPAAQAEPEPKPAVQAEETPAGVQAKDGKTIIPYEVLAEERRLRKEAQATLAEFNRLIDEADGTGEGVTLPNLTELEGKFPPELIGPLKAVYAKLGQMEQSNRSLTDQLTAKQTEELEHQQEAAQVIYLQSLSDTPLLAKLQQMKGPLYDQAKAIADRLIADDAHIAEVTQNGKADTLTARKAHNAMVEAEMRQLLGMPALTKNPPASEARPAAQPKALPELEHPTPESISEIPGGRAPAATEGEGFMNMDAGKSVAFLSKMSPKQQDEWLARSFR